MIRHIAKVMNAYDKYDPDYVFRSNRTNRELVEFLKDDREEFQIQKNTILDTDALYYVLSKNYNSGGGRVIDEKAYLNDS